MYEVCSKERLMLIHLVILFVGAILNLDKLSCK